MWATPNSADAGLWFLKRSCAQAIAPEILDPLAKVQRLYAETLAATVLPNDLSRKPGTLEKIAKIARIKRGPLTPYEALELIRLSIYFSNDPGRINQNGYGNRVVAFLKRDIEADVSATILRTVFASPETRRALAERLGFSETELEKAFDAITLRTSRGKVLFQATKALFFNTILFKLGFIPIYWPIYWPALRIDHLQKLDDLPLLGGDTFAIERLIRDLMPRNLRFHEEYRTTRRLAITAMLGLAVTVVATSALSPRETYERLQNKIQTAWGWERLMIGLGMSTTEDMRQHEHDHYTPSAVIEEQLQMWLDSFDLPPSIEEVEKQRALFEDQERRDMLRVFDEAPEQTTPR